MLKRLDSAELTEWIAFYKIEPWGLEVDDAMNALGPLVAYQTQKAKGPDRQLKDFLLFGSEPNRKRSTSELQARMTAAARIFNDQAAAANPRGKK